VGTLPRIFVPAVGALWTSSMPPTASSLSAIPRSSVPYPVAADGVPSQWQLFSYAGEAELRRVIEAPYGLATSPCARRRRTEHVPSPH
jgi:hypothetical protein